ncbi:MAG: ABC transporter permease [Candidatus Helarchaeota archaeon]|nr:ABC transporter permease [Candidatus Helarchaeota archaeon]
MNIRQYIKRDFRHRWSEIKAALITLIIINGLITFLLILGENFEYDLFNMISSNWLFQFIASYNFIIIVMGFISGFFIFFNIFSGMIISRQKEIGTIKAIGGIPETIKSVLLWEILIVAIVGVFLGIIFGILGYEIFYFFMKSMYFIQNNIPILGIIAQFILYIFLSWLFGGLQVIFTYGKSVAKLLSDDVELEEKLLKPKKTKSRKFRFGLAYNFAKRNIKRQRKKSDRLFLNILMGMILISVALMGSILFKQTVIDNQKAAYGENIVVVGHKDVVFQYTGRMVLYQMHLRSSLNYTRNKYLLDSTVIPNISSIPGIVIDSRLVMEYIVQEVPHIVGYNQIGQTRIISSFIIGAHPERFIPNTNLIEGNPFRLVLYLSGPYFITSGDWLESNLFDDSSVEHLLIHGPQGGPPNFIPIYKVLGICSDPINGGNVLYMNINHLQEISNITDHNLLLIKFFHLGSLIEIADELRDLGNDYIMLGTDWFLNNNLSYTNIFWIPFLIFPFILFGIIFYNLSSHLNFSIKRQLKDFRILRALGAKYSLIKKTIFIQSLMEILLPSALGIIIGAFITFYLIYTQIFSFILLILIAIGIFLSSFLIALISTYPALKLVKKMR